MGFETQDVNRKTTSILKVLEDSREPLGARVIAKLLNNYGVALGERAVRYHLKILDERGLTSFVGRRDGRMITEKGVSELKSALVQDKVGFAISRIELLAFRTDFDYERRRGVVPINVSFFSRNDFQSALRAMKPAFDSGMCVSSLVAVAESGERLGELIVPEGKIGFATVCSIAINGTLLKAGIPMDSRFGGILQIRNSQPVRFTEVIHYNGSSLDPSEIFIKARMTSVQGAASTGDGEILANFREIPAVCKQTTEQVIEGLLDAKIDGLMVMGSTSETVCEIPMELNRMGMVLKGGLNPVAAALEAGIEADNRCMSTLIDYGQLIDYGKI